MKLLYLWVEDYGILKDAEFNFDSNIRFHYEKEKNELKRVQSKNEIPENFFSLKNSDGNVVESVSAIIGNNGAGKTSVFKAFNQIVNFDVKFKFIIVFQFDNNFKVYQNISELLDIIMNDDKFFVEKFFIEKISDNKPSEKKTDNKPSGFSTVYYTPNYNPQDLDFYNCENISSSFLLKRDHERYYNNALKPFKDSNGKNFTPDKIGSHQAMEIQRNVRLISELEEKKDLLLNINYPVGVFVSINESDCLPLISGKSENRKTIDEIEKKFSYEHFDSEKKCVIAKILRAALYNFLRSYGTLPLRFPIKLNNYYEQLKKILENCENKSFEECVVDYFSEFTNGIDDNLEKLFDYPEAHYVVEMIDFLNSLPEDLFKNSENIYFALNDEKEFDDFIYFTELYFHTHSLTPYLNFSWTPVLSSGEISYLSMYSRFFDLLKKEKLSENIMVFLDEVEITLHPSKQKEMIENLIKFFNVFAENNRIHLVFATHSPIILSDIPVDNCCFLKRAEGTFITKVEENKKTTAFGSNIYNLYKSSFFMENGLMGLFAEGKISEVFDILKKGKEDISPKKLKYCEKVIENIGEVVVKRELERKILSKLSEEKRIEYYEKEIRKIKDKCNDTDKNN